MRLNFIRYMLDVANDLSTGAMAWKIISTTRPLKRTGSIAPVLVAIVDTAAMYTIGYTGLLISFLVGSDGQFAAVDALIPLIVSIIALRPTQRRGRCQLTTE